MVNPINLKKKIYIDGHDKKALLEYLKAQWFFEVSKLHIISGKNHKRYFITQLTRTQKYIKKLDSI